MRALGRASPALPQPRAPGGGTHPLLARDAALPLEQVHAAVRVLHGLRVEAAARGRRTPRSTGSGGARRTSDTSRPAAAGRGSGRPPKPAAASRAARRDAPDLVARLESLALLREARARQRRHGARESSSQVAGDVAGVRSDAVMVESSSAPQPQVKSSQRPVACRPALAKQSFVPIARRCRRRRVLASRTSRRTDSVRALDPGGPPVAGIRALR